MPLHDYQCGACNHQFEKLVGMGNPEPRKCPECGKLKLKKLLAIGAIRDECDGCGALDRRSVGVI